MTANNNSWSSKTDEWLVEALRGQDPTDQEHAYSELVSRYRPQLYSYVRNHVPAGCMATTVEKIEEGVIDYIAGKKTIHSLSALIWGIAQRQVANTSRLVRRDRQIEKNIALSSQAPMSLDDQLILWEQKQFMKELPFMDRVLSPCQRLIVFLRSQHDYSSRLVGRLTGSSEPTVNTHYSDATQTARDFVLTEEFELSVGVRNVELVKARKMDMESAIVIEQFSKQIIPNLTQDELKPLGLTELEFRTYYEGLLVVPTYHEKDKGYEFVTPSLLLIRQEDRKEWMKQSRRITKHPDDFAFPEACWVKMDIEKEFIHLQPESMIEIVNSFDIPEFVENNYLSSHTTLSRVPVTLGFLDGSLITSHVKERWPFAPTLTI